VVDRPAEGVLVNHRVVRTDDLSRAGAVLERVLPRVPVRLRGPGGGTRCTVEVNSVDVGVVTTTYLHCDADLHVVNSKTANYHVNVPLRGHTLWREGPSVVRASPTVAAVIGPGVAGELFWGADCGQLCVLMPPDSVARELSRHLGRRVAKPVEFHPEMKLSAASVQSWLDALRMVCRQAERTEVIHPLLAHSFQTLLINTLLVGQPHNYTAEMADPVSPGSSKAVREAIELLHARPEHPWSIGELAEQVHLSVSALQEGFARAIQLSPMRYLRKLRLDRVRTELLEANPSDTTVTEIAARWGFLHHGHFAAAYRAEFGESPTQTLRR
jgi:AraC-like DNA-binding protein